MSRELLKRIERLEALVAQLCAAPRSDIEREPTPEELWERLPPSATVGKEYVAYRFGCSVEAVQHGKAGTDKIPRLSRKPLKFAKREVDAAWRSHTQPLAERAALLRAQAQPRRRVAKTPHCTREGGL